MRVFIIRTKVSMWIRLISPQLPSSPFLPLLFSPSCPSFLLFSVSPLVPSIAVRIRRGRKWTEWIYIYYVTDILNQQKQLTRVTWWKILGMFQELKLVCTISGFGSARWRQKWGRCSIRDRQREQLSNLLRCQKWQDTEGTHKILRLWTLLIFQNLVKNLTYPSKNYLVHLSYTAKTPIFAMHHVCSELYGLCSRYTCAGFHSVWCLFRHCPYQSTC